MRLLLTILIFLGAVNAEAQLYKWVDKTGEVHYSDAPPAKDSKPLELPPLQTTPAVKYTKKKEPEKPQPEEKTFKYDKLAVISPKNDETIRDNAGNISILLSINPPLNLKENHYINILLDDRIKIKKSKSLSVTLNFIDRGSHSIRAEVRNSAGKLLKTSNSVTFHLHRFSILHPKPH